MFKLVVRELAFLGNIHFLLQLFEFVLVAVTQDGVLVGEEAGISLVDLRPQTSLSSTLHTQIGRFSQPGERVFDELCGLGPAEFGPPECFLARSRCFVIDDDGIRVAVLSGTRGEVLHVRGLRVDVE